jgi:hypothetical protein
MPVEVDSFEAWRLRDVGNMTHRTRGALVGPSGRLGRICRVCRKWSVAALAADAGVGIRRPDVCDIAVTLDARQLAGVDERSGLVRRQCGSPIGPELPVITWNEQPAQAEKQDRTDGEQRCQPKQMLVGSERLHLSSS